MQVGLSLSTPVVPEKLHANAVYLYSSFVHYKMIRAQDAAAACCCMWLLRHGQRQRALTSMRSRLSHATHGQQQY